VISIKKFAFKFGNFYLSKIILLNLEGSQHILSVLNNIIAILFYFK